MMDIKQKRRVAHALMHKIGALPNKQEVLAAYGVESTKDLSNQQIDDLIERLKQAVSKRYATSSDVRKWRSNVLLMLNKCGVYADNNDWTRVNKFLLDKRVAGKMLYELNVDEMKALYRKLVKIAQKVKEEAERRVYGPINLN